MESLIKSISLSDESLRSKFLKLWKNGDKVKPYDTYKKVDRKSNVKIFLLGNTNAGKSCLAQVFQGKTYEHQDSTEVLAVHSFEMEAMDGKTEAVRNYYTAGQVD